MSDQQRRVIERLRYKLDNAKLARHCADERAFRDRERATAAEARAKRLEEALRETLAVMRGLAVMPFSFGRCRICGEILSTGPHAADCAIGRAEETARKAMEAP